ncbi:hypothetical protein HDC92_004745 [Pedobacter sp. AK017]|uniref:hypothetical protein n=1 Tax=Pedobacter sp. AK017 TaxID=2723073 RepID=UPI00160E8D12|nr:hypothetical protein [Pedobacter sp. AK017]MBB5441041.1 hypothetical protein [Pedobacter sp. AK017]
MVLVVNYQQKENLEGKPFFTLTVQGEPELVVSQKGKPYLTARKASLMTTFEEAICKQLVGRELPGIILEVTCEPYDVTLDGGEVVTRNTRYEYQMEELVEESEQAVFSTHSEEDIFV